MRTCATLLLIILPGMASAQFYDKLYIVSWNVNQPLSNREFVGNASGKGMRLGYRELINDYVTLGVDLTWSGYNDYVPRQTYYSVGSTLTTDFFNYANNYGATLAGEYYFHPEKRLMPYVSFGAGVAYNNYKIYYNIFSSGDNSLGVLLRPQAGAWFRLSETSSKAIHAAVHMDYATAKSEETGYRQFINVGFQLGLVFLDW